jgi:aromatic ring-opening dioxygenase catalytic subunit (LigB family)
LHTEVSPSTVLWTNRPDHVPGPMLLREPESDGRFASMNAQATKGPLSRFLALFGPALLEKYKPKGIVVFSAHWEVAGEVLGEYS